MAATKCPYCVWRLNQKDDQKSLDGNYRCSIKPLIKDGEFGELSEEQLCLETNHFKCEAYKKQKESGIIVDLSAKDEDEEEVKAVSKSKVKTGFKKINQTDNIESALPIPKIVDNILNLLDELEKPSTEAKDPSTEINIKDLDNSYKFLDLDD